MRTIKTMYAENCWAAYKNQYWSIVLALNAITMQNTICWKYTRYTIVLLNVLNVTGHKAFMVAHVGFMFAYKSTIHMEFARGTHILTQIHMRVYFVCDLGWNAKLQQWICYGKYSNVTSVNRPIQWIVCVCISLTLFLSVRAKNYGNHNNDHNNDVELRKFPIGNIITTVIPI